MEGFKVLLVMCFLMSTSSVQGISNSGNEFNLMFPPNLGARSAEYPPILYVTTDEDGPVQFTVSYMKANPRVSGMTTHTATKNKLTRVELPFQMKDTFTGFTVDGGITLKAEEGKNIIVYALNEDGASTDVYLGLPYFETKTETYDYYGVSVPRSSLEPKATYGYMAIVILEANTVVTLTPTVQIEGLLFGAGLRFQPGRSYSSNPLAKGFTILLRAREDLTGSKISSNNPITFITGHQCGFLPSNVTACDHLTEQLPPAETFGFKFVLVPLLLREQDGYRIVASRDGTTVNLNCVDKSGSSVQKDSLSLDEGQFRQLFIHSDRFCTLEANLPIVVVQICLGHSFDEVLPADPFMVMIPPLGQYRNDYTLIFAESFSINSQDQPVVFKPYLSLSVPSECCNRGQIEFDDGTIPWDIFVDVKCEDGEICACAAQYEVPTAQSRGGHTVQHSISECTVGVIVYGYEKENSYGYPGGMNVDSIAVPNYCFKDEEAIGSEPSGVLRFTIENTGTPEAACVMFTTSDGSANAGTDFAVENSECCFEAGQREAVCEIKVNQDSDAEGEEDFTVSIVAKDGQCVCNESLTCKIIDDPVVVVEFNQTRYSVDEDAGFVCITVVLDMPAPANFSVEVSFTDGNATASEDYISTTVVVTFVKGASSATIKVPIIDDNQFERDEVFQASLSVPGDITGAKVTKGTKDEAQVTIYDKGNTIRFENRSYRTDESVGNFTEVRLVADQPFAEDTSVYISYEDISDNVTGGPNISVPDIDYGNSTTVVTFKAGFSFSTYASIPIAPDDEVEGDEQFKAKFELPGGYRDLNKGDPEEAVINITDVVTVEPPVFTFEEGSYEVNETAGTVRIGIVRKSGDIIRGESVTIDVTPRQGSGRIKGACPATEGDDFTSTTQQVVFQSSDSIQYVEIPITDDDVFEGTEYFYADLTISAGSGSVGAPNTTTVFIIDEGNTIRFENGNYRTDESVGNFTEVRLVADQPFAKNTSFNISFEGISATGGDDYENDSVVVTFEAGSRFSTNASIPIIPDDVKEPDEQFRATFELPGGYRNLNKGDPEEAVITIEDVTGNTIRFENGNYRTNESVGDFTGVRLVADQPFAEDTSVPISYEDINATGGDDYENDSVVVTFVAGSRFSTYASIPIIPDNLTECDEQFRATFELPGGYRNLNKGGPEEAVITIEDVTGNTIRFKNRSYMTNESVGNFTEVCLASDQPFAKDTNVNISFEDINATGGVDYGSGSVVVTFKAGSRCSTCASIPIIPDRVKECDEQFRATFELPGGYRNLNKGDPEEAVITIKDVTDTTIRFENGNYRTDESVGNFTGVRLVTDQPFAKDTSVPISFEDITATGGPDFTASDVDYGNSVAMVTFLAGSNFSSYASIPIASNEPNEDDEQFTATFELPGCYRNLNKGDPEEAVITIEDVTVRVASPGNVNFDPTIYNVSEGQECVRLFLMSDNSINMNYTVKVITQDKTAMNGSDYEGGEYDAVFTAGETTTTVCIPIIDDEVYGEGTECFVAFINATESSVAKRVQIGEDNEATVNIRDNEEICIDFDPVTYNVSEGDGFAILTVKASAPSSTPYTVMVDTQDGSAVDTGDYAPGPYQVEFPFGETEVTIMTPIMDDDIDECDENFFGNLRIPMQAANIGVKLGSADRATVTIKDDDKFQVNFVSTEMEVFEEQTRVRVCLEHNRACEEEFTVQIGNTPHSNRSASSPDDYQNGPYEVFFGEGEKRTCIDIPVIDDGVEEGPERFRLQIMPPDNGGVPFEPGSKPMAQITIQDGNIDGDPMFTVPLSINKKILSQFSKKDKQWDLCYEVHGREDKIYNLVSDRCVFVNTHLKLASNPKVGNIMARIGIVAKDYDGRCHKIQADLEGKKVTINDMQMKNRTWMGRGITVIKLGDKVRVSVPNCKGQKMVFWIVFHFMNGADMIKFIIADGNGLSPSSHGLMGQFWNTPVEIKAMKSEQADTGSRYRVIIYSPFTGPRQFTGDYYPITWDYGKTPCLYAGTQDGSPVIEGKFTEYEVKELFDPHFSYSQFKRKQCSE